MKSVLEEGAFPPVIYFIARSGKIIKHFAINLTTVKQMFTGGRPGASFPPGPLFPSPFFPGWKEMNRGLPCDMAVLILTI